MKKGAVWRLFSFMVFLQEEPMRSMGSTTADLSPVIRGEDKEVLTSLERAIRSPRGGAISI